MKRVPGVGVGDFYLDPDTQRRWSNNPGPKTHREGGHTILCGTAECLLINWRRQEAVLFAKECRTWTNKTIIHEDQEWCCGRKSFWPRSECPLKAYFLMIFNETHFERAFVEDGWIFPWCDSFRWWIGGPCLKPPCTHHIWRLSTHTHLRSSSLANLEALSGLEST